MQATTHPSRGPEHFRPAVDAALADARLKAAIDRTTGNAERKRADAVGAWPGFAVARDLGRRIKDHVVANLGHYLELFERNAVASGAQVHWARTSDEACRLVIDICRRTKARSV